MLDQFRRFAVYYAPDPGSDLARAGAAWLGRDAESGHAVAQPEAGFDLGRLTAAPRRYGLHGTLRPPMRLAGRPQDLLDAVAALAQAHSPIPFGPLRLRSIDGFLAIIPQDPPPALDALAAQIVRALDPFRAPAEAGELARRRAAGLSKRQEALLQQWGYPYVMEEFRFHITLTGRLTQTQTPEVLCAARDWFAPALAPPHALDALYVFGEDATGQFRHVRRFPMSG